MGDKWNEEQADEFLKDANPKGEAKFSIDDFMKKFNKK